jgi:hypothetical protein
MYKFIGGFINTLQPYNNDEFNSKLILTQNFLDNINLLLLKLKYLEENIDKIKLLEYIKQNKNIKDDDIKNYIEFCNIKKKELFKLSAEELLESDIMKDKYTVINNNFYFYQIYEIRNTMLTIFNEDNNIKISNLSQINDVSKFKKQLQDKIIELEKIKIKTQDLLKINCFSENQECVNIDNDNQKNPKDLIKYIGNTFGYHDYIKKFKKFNITKYILLQQFSNDDIYYDVSNTCSIEDPECRFFVINNNLSINEKQRDSIPIDKIRIIPKTHKLYFINTYEYYLSKGKMFKNDFINTINDIKKENIPQKYFNLALIEELLKILYRYDEDNNEYIADVIVKYDNILVFLAFINRIDYIYNAVININEPSKEHFDDIKEEICYSYNYYLYISKLHMILDNKKNIDIINSYLHKTKEEIYEEFIKNVRDLYTILINISLICEDESKLVCQILSNFLDKLFKIETKELPLPINKETIITSLTKTKPVLREQQTEEIKYYLRTLSNEDQYFNYKSDFEIFTYGRVKYENYDFPNCGENTLFHLFNYLLTHVFEEGEISF